MRAHSVVIALVATPLLLVQGCAGTGPVPGEQTVASASPERQCFSPQQVSNFRTSGTTTVYLKAGRAVFELETNGSCTDLDGTNRLAVMPELGSRLCSGDWATLAVPGSAQPVQRCRVQIVKVLSAEEVAALPSRDRP